MKRILCIVETAYRATQEEQDDAVLWLTYALKNAGSEMGVLLRSNAVNYAVAGQDPTGIVIGKLPIERPPYPDKDLLGMVRAGIPVHVVCEDVDAAMRSHGRPGTSMASSVIFLRRVLRLIPSSAAALIWFPPVRASTVSMSGRSSSESTLR